MGPRYCPLTRCCGVGGAGCGAGFRCIQFCAVGKLVIGGVAAAVFRRWLYYGIQCLKLLTSRSPLLQIWRAVAIWGGMSSDTGSEYAPTVSDGESTDSDDFLGAGCGWRTRFFGLMSLGEQQSLTRALVGVTRMGPVSHFSIVNIVNQPTSS